MITCLVLNSRLREGFKKKGTNLVHCTKFGYLLPPSELGTSLSEILLTVFFKFVELGLTDQFSSILVSKHLRRLGHSIWGVGPPPPLLGQCPKFVTFFKPSLMCHVLFRKILENLSNIFYYIFQYWTDGNLIPEKNKICCLFRAIKRL